MDLTPKKATEEPETIRIHVALAQRGLGSRRQIESWIKSGYIHVNGKPAKIGQKINLKTDKVTMKGKNVNTPVANPKSIVVALNKPRGVVTTVKDPEGRPTVMSLVPKGPRLFPVGRLDYNSEGLLLMTNDGDLAQRLTHPKFEIPKVYEVRIRGSFDDKKIAYIKKGVTAGNTKFKGAEILDMRDVTQEGVKKFQVRIKIFEGKNQEIRRMFESLKCRVIRLKRVEMGSVALKGIPYGGYRILSEPAVARLKKELATASSTGLASTQ